MDIDPCAAYCFFTPLLEIVRMMRKYKFPVPAKNIRLHLWAVAARINIAGIVFATKIAKTTGSFIASVGVPASIDSCKHLILSCATVAW